jgi:hypothetical protein
MASIKELLESGHSADELIQEYKKKVREADKEITKKRNIEQTRGIFVNAMVNYLVALGVAPREYFTAEEVKKIKQMFYDFEADVDKMHDTDFMALYRGCAEVKNRDYLDKVIQDFIKNL